MELLKILDKIIKSYTEWNNMTYLTDKIVKTTSFDQPDINEVVLIVYESLKKRKIEVVWLNQRKKLKN